MTEKKEKKRRGPWTKQQQHSGQEHCDGGRTMIKKQVNKMEEFTYEICSYQRTKVGTCIRYDCCTVVSCRPPSWCFRFSWFPGLPLPASWLPAFFLLCLWCCSESEDSVINLRIQHSNCLWPLFWFSSYMYIESISGLVAPHSVHKQFVPAHLANEQVTSVKQILFLWGHDPTLLLVRPGLHSTDVGLLWVCHCHCPQFGKKVLLGIFVGFELIARWIWKSDCGFGRFGKVGRIRKFILEESTRKVKTFFWICLCYFSGQANSKVNTCWMFCFVFSMFFRLLTFSEPIQG